MRLGRRSRARAELLDAVRAELATTRQQLDGSVANGLARLEQQLVSERDDHHHAMATLLRSLDALCATSQTQERALVGTLECLTDACQQLARSARDQQLAVTAALEQLTTALEQARAPRRESPSAQVLGGTIHPALPEPGDPPRGVDGPRPARSAVLLDGVEVRCRFADNQWVGGFEVCDVVHTGDQLRYRLRRRSDGYVLPTLFDETLVRDATAFGTQRNGDATRGEHPRPATQ